MSFVHIEDVGTTPRRRLTPHRRLQVWESTGGVCVPCGRRIDGGRKRWIVEHIRALDLGGGDELSNMGPAHEACARATIWEDHRKAARAKRQKIRHLGGEPSACPLPCGLRSALKLKIRGEIVQPL